MPQRKPINAVAALEPSPQIALALGVSGDTGMNFRTEPLGLFARVLALVSLLIGLGDATRLLGLWDGASSPITTIGAMGFVLLTALCLARLFAAVGLWIHSSWGALLLSGSLLVEIGFYLSGSAWVSLSLWGFIFKTAALLATIALLAFSQILIRRQVID